MPAGMMNARPADLKKADMTVVKAKATATKKGMYNCCLKHPCDWCALKMGVCPCGKSAAMSMPVCDECKGGWAAGDPVVRNAGWSLLPINNGRSQTVAISVR